MRAGLRGGSVPADADGGWLHDIADETDVVAPPWFEAFATGRDLAAAMVRNRVVRLPALTARVPISGRLLQIVRMIGGTST